MDPETKLLVATLRERDRLRNELAVNDAVLRHALKAWTESRPGHVHGVTTEAGARFLLGQAGLLGKERIA